MKMGPIFGQGKGGKFISTVRSHTNNNLNHFSKQGKPEKTFHEQEITDNTSLDWRCGRRVVELGFLADNLICKKCNERIHLSDVTKETRFGLGSILHVTCQKCLSVVMVPTGKRHSLKEGGPCKCFDINSKLAAAMLNAGIGETQVNNILAAVNIPTIHHKSLKKREREIGEKIETVSQDLCNEAIGEEINLCKAERSGNGSKTIMSVSSDGGWQRRGTGHSHNSLSGHVTMIGRYSKKCLNFAVAKKRCRFCTVAKRRRKPVTHHSCRKNWNGSAKGMEPHLTVTCLKNLQEKDFKVSHITMDDDTSTFTRVKRSILPDLIKCSDKNHVVRNMTNELYKLRNTHKTLSVTVINYLKKCFSYAVSQNAGDVDGMKRNISAIVPHAFGQHSLCQPSWCRSFERKEAYVHSSLPGGKDLDGIELRQALEKVFSSYTTELMADKLSTVQSSNSNENLNYLISRKAPKSMHFSDSESLDFRVSAAVAQKNEGHGYITKVIGKTGLSPGKFTSQRTKVLERKKQKRSRAQSSVQSKKRRLQLKEQRLSNEAKNELFEGTTYKTAVESEETITNTDTEGIPEPLVCERKTTVGQARTKQDHIIVFDLETTGLASYNNIIQIAAQHMTSEDKFTAYVHPPNGYIQQIVSRLTGIECHGNVMFHHSIPVTSISLQEALTLFKDWLENYHQPSLVAHNAQFDARFLVAGFQTARIQFPIIHGFADTLKLFRTTNPGLKSYKLESLMTDILNTSFSAHDATQDVNALIKLLKIIPDVETKLTVFSQIEVSLRLEQLSNEKLHVGSYTELIENKAISKASAKSLARSGLSARHLKIAFDRQGIDGLKILIKRVIPRYNILLKSLCQIYSQGTSKG